MKIKWRFLSVFTFTVVLFTYSIALADSNAIWGALLKGIVDYTKNEKQKQQEEEFNNKIDDLLRNLPTTARVAVLDTIFKVPEFNAEQSGVESEELTKVNKALQSAEEKRKNSLEEYIGKSGITVIDREALKEIVEEMDLSSNDEFDPETSTKFGKLLGATHLLRCKAVYKGFKSGHPTVELFVKVTEVESGKRIGTVNYKFDIDVSVPESLVNESFYVGPLTYKSYYWYFTETNSLHIKLNANSDVDIYVVDGKNYNAFLKGMEFRGYEIKERVLSSDFSVTIPQGEYYLVISNKRAIFTRAGVALTVLKIPLQ